MLFNEEKFTYGEVVEMINQFSYAEISEELFNAKELAKYSHLLEGHTYAEASELMFHSKIN